MTENISYKPVGGIVRAQLYAVGEHSTIEAVLATVPTEVPLKESASHYEENFSVECGRVGVHHTLTLVASAERAAAWLDEEFQRSTASEGVVARISLASGEELIAGWCEHLGGEAALRTSSLRYTTHSSAKQEGVVSLTMEGYSVGSARHNPHSTIVTI